MTIKRILLIGLVILLGIMFSWWLLWPRTSGTLTLTAPDGTVRTEELTTCRAGFGSRHLMFGIHVKTVSGIDVFFPDTKLIPSVAMPIELIQDKKTSTSIDTKTCATFQNSLGWEGGNIYSDVLSRVSGNIEAHCSLPDGTKLTLDASVRGCKLR